MFYSISFKKIKYFLEIFNLKTREYSHRNTTWTKCSHLNSNVGTIQRINNFPILFCQFHACSNFSQFQNSLEQNKYSFCFEKKKNYICFRKWNFLFQVDKNLSINEKSFSISSNNIFKEKFSVTLRNN